MAWTTQKYERIHTLRCVVMWVYQEEAASACCFLHSNDMIL
jgi:hypothetical protein